MLESNLVKQYLQLWAGSVPRSRVAHDLANFTFSLPKYLRAERRDRGEFIRTFMRRYKGFKVSEIVVARRSLDLGLIGREAFVAFYDEYRREWQGRAAAQKPGGGNFFASQDLRVGRRFASAVVRAVRNHDLLYSEAFELTGLHGDTFDKYASRIADQGEP